MKRNRPFWIVVVSVLIVLVADSCKNKESVFEVLSTSSTGIEFENNLPERPGFGILYYIYYYNGGGVATGDINNDGLTDIYFTANSKGNNKLYLNKGNFRFEDITKKAGVAGTADWCSGVTMADVNSDGFLDIYVSAVSGVHHLTGSNQLYINNQNGTFTESARTYGLHFSGLSTQAAFFDYDHDGDLDCYLLNHSQKPHANIVDTSNRKKVDPLSGDRLYRNDRNGGAVYFTEVSALAGIYQSSLGYGLGISVADLNNDGWEDIYIGNDFHENDYYYVNNKNGTFTESGSRAFDHYSRFSMGNDIADYNNDGQLDIVTVDMLPQEEKVLKTYGSDENPDIYKVKLMQNGFQHQYSKNCLQRNNGNGSSFSETALLSGVAATDWSWAPLFADFDNDGNKDLFVSSGIVKRPVDLDFVKYVSNLYLQAANQGTEKYDAMALEKMPDGASHPFLFKGKGSDDFEDMSAAWRLDKLNGYYTGSAYADLDKDGDLDLVINAINAPAVVLKNNAPKKNFVSLSFAGDSFNRFGVGVKAYLFQKGKQQYQQLMPTRGFQSSTDPRLHFGLDSALVIDSIVIVWPDARYQTLKQVASNKHYTIDKQNAQGTFSYEVYFPAQPPYFVDQTDNSGVQWQHKENEFVDFNVQYLIPHAQSTRGPRIAVGDVNADGLDDFYTCGAKGQGGALFIQQKNGQFKSGNSKVFEADALCEDVDAVFFDANGDNQLDLYVVSGGNEYFGDNPYLLDRLYMNQGDGQFVKANENLPHIYQNKSCVSTADVDRDGDQDLFIGVLADSRAFGVPQTSYLLLNDGSGKFASASIKKIDLNGVGIVTSCQFADLNKDGWQDILVAGEWMPLTIYINNKGSYKKALVPSSTGLWQTVYTDDVNGDGHLDLLAGNWGWNNKFWSGKNGPLRMYVADFDNNGKPEQLVSYTIQGVEYPFLTQDEVERPLPLLKKHYLHYAEYAGVPMKEVFYGWIDNVTPITAERLGSVVGYGDGTGNFEIQDFPRGLQLAPIMSFQRVSARPGEEPIYLAGGNFFDVIPYEGRYDAQAIALFIGGKERKIQFQPQNQLAAINGQVRDCKWLRTASGNLLVVARNNEPLLFFKPNNN